MNQNILNQIETWRRQLLDLSKRNRLINCPQGLRSMVEVVRPDPEAVWRQIGVGNGAMQFVWKRDLFDDPKEQTSQSSGLIRLPDTLQLNGVLAIEDKERLHTLDECAASPRLSKSHLLTNLTDRVLSARLNKLAWTAETSLTEQGVNVLFLAIGFLKWFESSDDTQELFAPLMLVPVELSRTGPVAPWKLMEYEDEVIANLCLREKLSAEYGFELPDFPEEGLEIQGGRLAYLDHVRESLQRNSATKKWDVVDGAILGAFGFQKIAMWKDLGDNRERIASHPLCRAIAGDLTADPTAAVDLPNVRDFDDQVHPRELHTILDCDSSQLEAIYAVKRGVSIVLDGPPGTGKSQTIANLIAEFLADGKTVLFVSEKMAALEVVKRRLDQSGLGDFVLECHSHAANKKEIIQELGRCLELPLVKPRDQSDQLDRLFDERKILNCYVRSLHTTILPLGITPFTAHTLLATLHDAPRIDWSDPNIMERDQRWLDAVGRALDALPRLREVVSNHSDHPWRGCKIEGYSLGGHDDLRGLFLDLSGTLNRLVDECQRLVDLQLIPRNVSPISLANAIEEIERLIAFPMFPATWLKEGPSQQAKAIFAIAEEANQLREMQDALDAFTDEALTHPISSIIAEFNSAGASAIPYLKPTQHASIRSHGRHLDELIRQLSDLVDSVEQLLGSLQDFGHTLGFPFPETTGLNVIERLVEVGRIVGSDGHFFVSWFDENRRKELTSAIGRLKPEEQSLQVQRVGILSRLTEQALEIPCGGWIAELQSLSQVDLDAARSAQARLTGRFSSAAFMPEGLARAEEALRYQSIFTWMLGGWEQVRQRAAELYVTSLPVSSVQMLTDMQEMKDFHLRHQSVWSRWTSLRNDLQSIYHATVPDSLHTIQAELNALKEFQKRRASFVNRLSTYLEDIPLTSDGERDWRRLESGLRSLDHLQTLGVRLSARLKQLLSSSGAFNQEDVLRAANELGTRLSRVNQSIDALKPAIAVGRIGNESILLQKAGLASICTWLTDLRIAITERRSALEGLSKLLKSTSDIPLTNIEQIASQIDEYVSRRTQFLDTWEKQRSTMDQIEDPLLTDWAPWTDQAQALSAFAVAYGERPTDAVVSVVTEPDVREQIASDLSVLRCRLDETWPLLWSRLQQVFSVHSDVSTGITLNEANLQQLLDWSQKQASELHTLPDWIRFEDLRGELCRLSVESVLPSLFSGSVSVDEVQPAFRARFYRLWLDAVYRRDPILRGFEVTSHEETIKRFRELDRKSIRAAASRVAERLLSATGRPRRNEFAPKDSEIRVLMHQASLKRRHWPLRRLFSHIPTILPRLKPCIMMSPLAVSTYFDSPKLQFDLVVFDEASQIRPFDAIGVIYRGKQLVVAGDPRQLPPTSFFDKLISDGDDSADAEQPEDLLGHLDDFESILEVCTAVGLPRRRLCWHYRSRREPLIAFSNRHFYDSELVTFPSVFDVENASAVTLDYCPNGRWKTGKGGGFNPVEVQRVAELIVEHARTYPRKSLGVITFNQRQQSALREELDLVAQNNPELTGFLFGEGAEPFFVKNLENVQGDERDRIIISVAYGFDDEGRFAMRFGPLNQQGGERRLNVAITRAKEEIIVVSSIRTDHIKLGSTQSRGVHLLKAYLDFAQHGPAASARVSADEHNQTDGQFESEIEQALNEKGYLTKRRIGCSGTRLDLALLHPNEFDRFILGIEFDGFAYDKAATARDRDRLRDEILRGLGWKLCRIWSAEWIVDRERLLARIDAAYQDSLIQRINPDSVSGNDDDDEPEVIDVDFEPVTHSRLGLEIIEPSNPALMIRFAKIDDVSEGFLNDTVLELVRASGRTEQDSLIRAVSFRLGFRRLGKKIQERINWSIRSLVRKRLLNRDEDRTLSIPQ